MRSRKHIIDANKHLILREAREMFRKRGFSATTMDALAKAAGISKSTVYVYFKSKEDIFLHILLEGLVNVREAIHGLAATFSTMESFHGAVCDFFVEIHNKDPLFFHGIAGNRLVDESRHAHANLVGQIDAVREEILMVVLDTIAQTGYGVTTDLDKTSRLELGYILWACVYGIISFGEAQARFLRERLDTDKRAFMRLGFERLVNLFVHVCDSPTRRCRPQS